MLPIDSLTSQSGFKLPPDSSSDLVTLFRNFWFICVLFRFTSDDHPAMNEWQRAALARIASKTPPIVLERAADYVTSDLEYNPVLRQEYMQMVRVHCLVELYLVNDIEIRNRLSRSIGMPSLPSSHSERMTLNTFRLARLCSF